MDDHSSRTPRTTTPKTWPYPIENLLAFSTPLSRFPNISIEADASPPLRPSPLSPPLHLPVPELLQRLVRVRVLRPYHRGRVDDHSPLLRQAAKRPEVFPGERPVEDVDVLLNALGVLALGDGARAALDGPADEDLGRGLVEPRCGGEETLSGNCVLEKRRFPGKLGNRLRRRFRLYLVDDKGKPREKRDGCGWEETQLSGHCVPRKRRVLEIAF